MRKLLLLLAGIVMLAQHGKGPGGTDGPGHNEDGGGRTHPGGGGPHPGLETTFHETETALDRAESRNPGGGTTGGVPSDVSRLADQLPISRRRQKTEGYAYSSGNTDPVHLVSGAQSHPTRDDLKYPYSHANSMNDHVEGQVAARMREDGAPKDVTLVINKEPCPGPGGCDANLAGSIPKGSTLTVYVKDENGVVQGPKVYNGTGEYIK